MCNGANGKYSASKKRIEKIRSRSVLTGVMVSAALPAMGCGVCVANMSYNGMPFTAAWVIVFLVWLAVLGVVYQVEKRKSRDVAPLATAVKSSLKYLAVLLVLYLFGMHLIAILVLPILLLSAARRLRPASRSLSMFAAAMLAILVVAVPVSYAAFPKVASEPGTRVKATQVKKQLQGLVQMKSGADDSAAVDPFAYTMFNVPVLNAIVQGFGTFIKESRKPDYLEIFPGDETTVARSRGPDGTFDLPASALEDVMTSASKAEVVGQFAYDATNGIISRGDIIVVK